ncbi:MAG: 50S ribosomal protein L32 [Candidatus Colwellbacteria bacterium]|nr:50S ribosomal protein L32 [Candidatus Colwellbacteria bacterium]
MGVPKKHHTKSKVGRRRSGHGSKLMKPMSCPNCKAPILPHRACANCGSYGGRIQAETAIPKEEEDE